ncbi:MAG: hypothetical protein AAFX09_00420 [Pseudomonadota bacterium]
MSQASEEGGFALGRALGFWWQVLRARPIGFVIASVFQAVITAGASVWMLAMTAGPSLAYFEALEASGGQVTPEAIGLMGQQQLTLWAGVVITLVAFTFSEAVWLRLFAKGRTRILPTGGDELRVFFILLITFGGMFALLLLAAILAAVLGGIAGATIGAAGGVLIGALIGIAGFVAVIWFGVRATPAAGLSVARGRFAFGSAFARSARIFWPLLGALFVALLIYIIGVIAIMALAVFIPGPVGPLIAASLDLNAAINDPSLQYRLIQEALDQPGGFLALWFGYAVMALLYSPIMAMWRGIGVRAALDFDAENETP